LQPHPAQTLHFAFDPEYFVAELTGAAPGEKLVLLPVDTPETAEAAVGALGDIISDYLGSVRTDCQGHEVPLMIGTNAYSLERAGRTPAERPNAIAGSFGNLGFYYCINGSPGAGTSFAIVTGRPGRLAGAPPGISTDHSENCLHDDDFLPPASGQMSMSLAVKFQSSTSGTGILVFEGKQNGYEFRAAAPVTLER
jgi:hypothetical protein